MKKFLALGVLIGLLLASGQLFYVRSETRPGPTFDMRQNDPDAYGCEGQKVITCGYCPPERLNGDFCTSEPYSQTVRGWPKRWDTYGSRFSLNKTDDSSVASTNAALLFAGSLAVFAGIGYVVSSKELVKAKPKSTTNKRR